MCAIAGEIRPSGGISGDRARDVQAVLKRRGPDQNGIYLSDSAVLVHTRLCVVDIENGRQPMSCEYGGNRYVIVYNGELYNTAEIRDELIARGCEFRGHSDTEVVLNAFAVFGSECVYKFNGIFAFAIWDEKKRRLFFARDRIGVKPFFYTVENGRFLFASEIKGILAASEKQPELDARGVMEIMLIGPGRTPGYGVFKGVEELKPACCGFFDENGLRLHEYWRLEDREHTESFEETAEHVRFLVTDSIRRQLVSDVPLGTFLSGGLDSSLISSVASRVMKEEGKTLKTFTVNYRDNDRYFKATKFQPGSDSQFVGKMVDYLGCESHMIEIDTPELVSALFEAVKARDLPGMADVDSSLLLFCREIKKHVTVALSGECADEIFGGYPWYRDPTIREKDGFPWAQSTAYRGSFIRREFTSQIDPQEYVQQKYNATVQSTSKLKDLSPLESRMKEMVNLNHHWFMQTLLDRKDRMSMYSGLEVRVPFCDWRIAEYLYSVPWEYKDYRSYEKGLLREAMKDYLPEEILWRKKSPYPKTHHPAYLAAVTRLLDELVWDSSAPIWQIVRRDKAAGLINAPNNPQPWYGQLMTTPQTIAYLLQVNYWLQQYNIRLV